MTRRLHAALTSLRWSGRPRRPALHRHRLTCLAPTQPIPHVDLTRINHTTTPTLYLVHPSDPERGTATPGRPPSTPHATPGSSPRAATSGYMYPREPQSLAARQWRTSRPCTAPWRPPAAPTRRPSALGCSPVPPRPRPTREDGTRGPPWGPGAARALHRRGRAVWPIGRNGQNRATCRPSGVNGSAWAPRAARDVLGVHVGPGNVAGGDAQVGLLVRVLGT